MDHAEGAKLNLTKFTYLCMYAHTLLNAMQRHSVTQKHLNLFDEKDLISMWDNRIQGRLWRIVEEENNKFGNQA